MRAPDHHGDGARPGAERAPRADARRNVEALLRAAVGVFAEFGVDAPMRAVAEAAGVGVGTLYRHFPQRSDLIVAVFRQEVDACADAAAALAAAHAPDEALARWLGRYVEFIATKRGLAAALHGGDPAYDALPGYFEQRLRPTVRMLLDAATAAGTVRGDVEPWELLRAAASLCRPADDVGARHAQRMVALLVDGLRYGAGRR